MRKRSRVVNRQHTPAIQGQHATSSAPYQPSIPGNTVTTTTEESEGKENGGGVSTGISGDPQVVMVLLTILFFVIAWKDLWSNFFSMIWDPSAKSNITSLNWGKYLGMIVFIAIAVSLSLASDEMAGLMMMLAIALLAVYLIENNGGGVTALLNWVTGIGTPTSGTSKSKTG